MWLLLLLPSSRHFTTVGGERTNVSSRLIAISAVAVTVAVAAGGDPSPLSDNDALADPRDGLPLRVRVRSPVG
jgi:hypothetical protein